MIWPMMRTDGWMGTDGWMRTDGWMDEDGWMRTDGRMIWPIIVGEACSETVKASDLRYLISQPC
jgi:hypothetical protein